MTQTRAQPTGRFNLEAKALCRDLYLMRLDCHRRFSALTSRHKAMAGL